MNARDESAQAASSGPPPEGAESSPDAYAARRDRLAEGLRSAGSARIGLAKETSNLFRDRAPAAKHLIDVRAFDHVLSVDVGAGAVDVEGMTPYESLVSATLAHGVMPAVVPELKTITIGGAAAGVGIEASSFRYGLVHETLIEYDVLLGDGRVVTCRADNGHADLFYGFPNSYGTLGYALRVRARVVPVAPYVELTHRRFADPKRCFEALQEATSGDAGFVDAVAFGPADYVLNVGRFVSAAPYTSDYTYEKIYYRSLHERELDYLTVHDFIWRWDTDWFWCSKNVGAQNPLLRRLYGRGRLGSRHYQRMMRWNSRHGCSRAWFKLTGGHHESVIQDVDIAIEDAPRFLAFFQREIGIAPVWLCPTRAGDRAASFPLFPMRPGALYINFGFWDVLHRRQTHPEGHFNRLIEAEVSRLGGIKSLYSESYFERQAFDVAYGGERYRELKAKYDPQGVFPELYAKCVLRH